MLFSQPLDELAALPSVRQPLEQPFHFKKPNAPGKLKAADELSAFAAHVRHRQLLFCEAVQVRTRF
jgi:hypothetical protein